MIYGGSLLEIPKPWKFFFDEPDANPRRITIKSIVWPTGGIAIGANGHHHADIREEDNMVWDSRIGEFDQKVNGWTRTGISLKNFSHEEYDLQKQYIDGRRASNSDLVAKKDVIKWAVGILKEWGVLKNPKYKIEWDLDDDDPNASQERARLMRKRAMDRD